MGKKYHIIYILIIGLLLLSACQITKKTSQPANTTSTNQQHIKLPDQSLKRGDKGKHVTMLQKSLAKLGYDINENHRFDQATMWALKDFQAQQVKLAATGVYNEQTKQWLKKALAGDFNMKPGKGISKADIVKARDGIVTVSNPTDQLVLVNKHHALPDGYIPDDLVVPDVRFPFTEDLPKKYMRKTAADALAELFTAGDKKGVHLFAQSGYRSYTRQVGLFQAYVNRDGEKAANKYSAKPGQSEHQTGLTMDITSTDNHFKLSIPFADTAGGKWVQQHAHEYGFIIRYPKGKEDITGYQYEPWHLRYVGIDAATVIYENELTLEEYLGVVDPT